jgi:ELWxxDGT repeat protein
MKYTAAALVIASIASVTAVAEPRMIATPGVAGPGSLPPVENLTDFGGILYFTAWDAEHGQELWRSDGTAAGTGLFMDILPGPGSSFAHGLVTVGNQLFFVAHDSEAGFQIWCSDGTTAGTHRLKAIGRGAPEAMPWGLIGAGGKLFFIKPQEVPFAGDKLWCSDGTEAGTRQVNLRDTYPGGPVTPGLGKAAALNGHLYFMAGFGVWRSDGTDEGTVRIMGTGVNGSWEVFDFAATDDRIYAIRFTPSSNFEIWENDGSADGTAKTAWWDERFETLYPEFATTGSKHLLFAVRDRGDFDYSYWMTDGSPQGTRAFPDNGPATGTMSDETSGSLPKGFIFPGHTPKQGEEPWFSDGTVKGTRLLGNLAKGTGSSAPADFVRVGGKIFFTAQGTKHGREVWHSNGNPRGTRLLGDLRPGELGSEPTSLTACGGRVFWLADDGIHGVQLWRADGKKKGTLRLTGLPPRPDPSSEPLTQNGTALRQGEFYFPVLDASGNSDLWTSDGSAAGTRQLTGEGAGTAGSSPRDLVAAGTRVFFQASDGNGGNDLWMSDGTPQGTTIAHQVPPADQAAGWEPRMLGELGGKVFVTEANDDRLMQRGLFRHDGNGPFVAVGPGATPPGLPGQVLIYSGYDVQTGLEPWATDGTLEGSRLLRDLMDGYSPGFGGHSSFVRWLGSAGGLWYFRAQVQIGNYSPGGVLCVTDGTPEGTKVVSEFTPGYASESIDGEGALGGRFVFKASTMAGGEYELWSTDGTEAGTLRLFEFERTLGPEPVSFSSGGAAQVGDKLFFVANHSPSGAELWTTDGSSQGTRMVHEIRPGEWSSRPLHLTAVGNKVYFVADDGIHGRELWCSDGTSAGTVMVKDLTGDSGGSSPWGLKYDGTRLFFMATTEASGTQPYVIDSP